MSLVKKGFAEFIGTFTLVFISCGVAAATGGSLVATALAFGLSLIAMAYSIGRISGCHINPAVSLGVFVKDKLNKTPSDEAFGVKDLLVYIGAQILGGFVGAVLIFGIAKMGNLTLKGDACNYALGSGANAVDYPTAGPIFGALIIELVLTFLFVYVILNVTSKKFAAPKMAGLIIGLTLTVVHLLGINFTGTSVNPARSIATALAAWIFNGTTNAISQIWIFIVAPLLGGVLAAVVYHLLHQDDIENKAEIKK
jgi:aquaporin Z